MRWRRHSFDGSPRSQLDARRAVTAAVSGLALVFLAFFFDAAPLFVPGVALFTIGVLAPVWVWSSTRGARVRRHLSAERIVEGEPLAATIEVRRAIGVGGWGRLEVLEPLTSERLRLGGPGSPLRGSRSVRVQVVARFERRGEQRISPPRVVARDPLDLARAQTPGDGVRQTLLVLPRTEAVRWLGSERSRRLKAGEGDAATEALAATDLEGLRPYRPGTPASRIYWPALARGRGLVVRRLQPDGDRRPLVVLDARERSTRSAEHPEGDTSGLDAAVRAAASLVLDLARAGGCGLLLPGQPRATIIDPELTAWPAAYARLALVGTDSDPRPTRAPTLAAATGRTGPLVYVTAASHERLVAALSSSAGRGTVVLVVPDSELVEGRPRGAGARAVPALSVSGCRGFALGAPRRHSSDAPAVAGAA